MADRELLYRIALSVTKGVTTALVERMKETGVEHEAFFTLPTHELIKVLGVNERYVPRLDARHEAVDRARSEIKFVVNNNIKVLELGEAGYPRRLAQCPDAPPVIYLLGNADLDSLRIMGVVGTRRCTSVGIEFIDKCIGELAGAGITPVITSGLAYGIDAAAHETALKYNLPTVGVVAHGLDTIYPAANRQLARNIIRSGGAILSEYPSHTQPYRPRFLERNRIVAGLTDLTLVVESEVKGGAMSTARLAFEYDREVGAVPGRFSDTMSSGCNHLININRATLISSAADIMELMDWRPLIRPAKGDPPQLSLFSEMDNDQKMVYKLLQNSPDPLPLHEIQNTIGMAIGPLLSLMGEMEFDGLVVKLPGNKFRLSGL